VAESTVSNVVTQSPSGDAATSIGVCLTSQVSTTRAERVDAPDRGDALTPAQVGTPGSDPDGAPVGGEHGRAVGSVHLGQAAAAFRVELDDGGVTAAGGGEDRSVGDRDLADGGERGELGQDLTGGRVEREHRSTDVSGGRGRSRDPHHPVGARQPDRRSAHADAPALGAGRIECHDCAGAGEAGRARHPHRIRPYRDARRVTGRRFRDDACGTRLNADHALPVDDRPYAHGARRQRGGAAGQVDLGRLRAGAGVESEQAVPAPDPYRAGVVRDRAGALGNASAPQLLAGRHIEPHRLAVHGRGRQALPDLAHPIRDAHRPVPYTAATRTARACASSIHISHRPELERRSLRKR
jgi:hypothetical protein